MIRNGPTHNYGWSRGRYVTQAIYLFVIGSLIAFTVQFLQDTGFALGVVLLPVVVSLGLTMMVVLANLLGTRVYVSPMGIELRSVFFRQRARWADVERIDLRPQLWGSSSGLLVRKSELGGPSWLLAAWRRLGGDPTYIALNGIEGWLGGGLEDDLRLYAPQLFEVGRTTLRGA